MAQLFERDRLPPEARTGIRAFAFE